MELYWSGQGRASEKSIKLEKLKFQLRTQIYVQQQEFHLHPKRINLWVKINLEHSATNNVHKMLSIFRFWTTWGEWYEMVQKDSSKIISEGVHELISIMLVFREANILSYKSQEWRWKRWIDHKSIQ